MNGQAHVVSYLLRQGADANASDSSGETFFAVFKTTMEINRQRANALRVRLRLVRMHATAHGSGRRS